MSIEHKLILKGNRICLEYFINFCVNKYINFDLLDNESIYLNDLGMSIHFRINKENQDSIWQSCVFNVDFKYDVSILFRFEKNTYLWEEQLKFTINCVFDVMSKTKQEGLFIYNLDTEICYFKTDGTTQIVDDFGIIDKFLINT